MGYHFLWEAGGGGSAGGEWGGGGSRGEWGGVGGKVSGFRLVGCRMSRPRGVNECLDPKPQTPNPEPTMAPAKHVQNQDPPKGTKRSRWVEYLRV